MSIINLARRDAQFFTGNGRDFATEITIVKSASEYVVNGTAKKHHTAFDEMGNVVNTASASCTISDTALRAAGINLWVDGEVAKKETDNLRVKFADAKGDTYTYKVKEFYPDEHLGLIVFILGNG